MALPGEKKEKVVYIGSDAHAWQIIQDRFIKDYPQLSFDFSAITPSSELHGQDLFIKLIDLRPQIIYLDFTEIDDSVLLLSELLGRDNSFQSIPLVGLVDHKKRLAEHLGTEVDLIFVKGAETHDMAYFPLLMSMPKRIKGPQFAKAEMSEKALLTDDLKVGYITPLILHTEGNIELKEGDKVRLKTGISKKQIKSEFFLTRKITKSNLYYNFEYGYDFEFVFVDKPVLDELVDAEEVDEKENSEERKNRIKEVHDRREERIAEYEDEVKRSRKKHSDWVMSYVDPGTEKKTKVLVVDEKMRFLRSEATGPIDKFPFSIRCQTYLRDDLYEVDRVRPSIIAIQLLSDIALEDDNAFAQAVLKRQGKEVSSGGDIDEKSVESILESLPNREKKEMGLLSSVIQKVKSIENYSPIIVLFRCYFQNSSALQQTYQYPMIVTHNSDMSMDVITGLAEVYERRQSEKHNELITKKIAALKEKEPKKYQKLSHNDFIEKKYFINKKNALSYCSLDSDVLIKSLTESEVIFECERELLLKSYRLNYPFPMSVTLIPIEEGKDFLVDKEVKIYRGLIHSISELDKKELRKNINDAFFGPLMEQRKQEEEDYQKRHEEALLKRDAEEEQKAKEELLNAEEALSTNRLDDEDAGPSKEDKDPEEK